MRRPCDTGWRGGVPLHRAHYAPSRRAQTPDIVCDDGACAERGIPGLWGTAGPYGTVHTHFGVREPCNRDLLEYYVAARADNAHTARYGRFTPLRPVTGRISACDAVRRRSEAGKVACAL